MAILPDRSALVTPADGDLLFITDVSDTTDAATGTDKKITWSDLKTKVVTYSATAPTSPSDGDLWVDTSEQLALPVTSSDITNIVALTQAEYDALTPDASTLYVITD